MSEYFVLENRKVVPAASPEEWARRFGSADRHVANTEIGDVRVSTVFLGINHRHFGDGPPLVFETMIFGGEHNDYQTRAATWEEAVAQHAEALALVRRSLN